MPQRCHTSQQAIASSSVQHIRPSANHSLPLLPPVRNTAQSHDFRHHHHRPRVTGDHGADGRRHQQVDLTVRWLYLWMAMPVDIEQADEQAAQPQRNQPDSIQRRNLQHVTGKRHHAAHRASAGQRGEPRACRTQAADRAADTGNPAAQRFYENETENARTAAAAANHATPLR